MEHRLLGTTGLHVSALSLGAMGFGGGPAVGAIDRPTAERMVSMAIDAGVVLFDSANGYGGGGSEEILGAALGRRRDEVLISTKAHARVGPGPNDVGQSRWHLQRACEDSLRRLGTDRIDLYHVHGFDGLTPLEEVLRTLDGLVTSGKVRYLACSNYAAWQLVKALGVSERLGLDRYVAVQAYYSLVARELEWEIIPACRDQGLGVLVWSPLAGGLLSGKFGRDEVPAGTRRAEVGDTGIGPVDHERAWRIVDVCRGIAEDRGVSVAQVALNWVRANTAVSSVIVGARNVEQLADNLAAASWSLDGDEERRLEEASALPLPYPHWFQRQFSHGRRPGDTTGRPAVAGG